MKQVGQDLRRKADSAVSNYVQLHFSHCTGYHEEPLPEWTAEDIDNTFFD